MSTFLPSPEFDAAIEKTSKEKFGCAICEEPIIEAMSTNCGHQFCDFCLKKWMMYFNRCPVCKSIVTTTAPRPRTDKKLRELYKLATPDLQSDRSMCINYRKLHQLKLKLGGEDKGLITGEETVSIIGEVSAFAEIKARAFALLNGSPTKVICNELGSASVGQCRSRHTENSSPMNLVTSSAYNSDHVSNLFGAASSKHISDRLPLILAKISPTGHTLAPYSNKESTEEENHGNAA